MKKSVKNKSVNALSLIAMSCLMIGAVNAQGVVGENVKNVVADKTIAVDNPIKMTETYKKRVDDKSKILNAQKVSVINESNKVNGTVVSLGESKKAEVVAEKVEVKKVEPRKLMKESEIIENVGMTNHNIEKLGNVNSRLEYVNQLKLLKQAEYDLLQPPEDKNLEKEKKAEVVKEPTAPYNPVGNVSFNTAAASVPKVEVVNLNNGPDFSNVSVYSIIGFDGKYSAKVSLDGQSTYTINKGDTLPNGSIVTDITRYYIVVAEKSAVGRPLSEPQRIYATGKPLSTSNSAGGAVSLSNSGPAPTSLPAAPVGGMISPTRR